MNAARERIDRVVERLLQDTDSYDGKMWEDAGRLWRNYLREHQWQLYLALFVTVVWSVHPYVVALLSRFLVDDVLAVEAGIDPAALDRHLRLFWRYVGFLFGLWAVFLVSHWSRSRLIIGVGQQLVYDLRKQLHEKLQELHVGFFDRIETGKLMSRVLDDVGVIREWTITHSLNVSAYLIRIVLGIGVLLALNWKLSLLILAAMPLYAWSFVRLLPIIRKTSIALRRLNSGMYGLAQERIGGVAVVKAFAQERREELTFAARMNHWVRLSMRLINFQEILGLVAGVITAIVTGLIIYIGMTHVRDGIMSLGDVMVFIYALPNLFLQVKALSTVLTAIQAFFVVVRRVFVLLDAKEQVVPGARTLDGTDGTIELDGVWFSYPGQDGHALRDVGFRVEPGERVAIMGPSGAGKTTVFNLICRFYDPERGVVRVGGIHLVDADPHSVREHVCMVQQEPVIFTGTVAENIAYGHPDARPSDIMRAAKQAELHEFIMTLPVKYETEVGRNGISLSGGQKQRLALATALLTDPEVLLLDDTTSALDAETEARIRATLNNVLAGRTSLIITQRIATARDCHKILVFEDGRVTQVGNHDSLLHLPGFYRRIYQQQESLSLERS